MALAAQPAFICRRRCTRLDYNSILLMKVGRKCSSIGIGILLFAAPCRLVIVLGLGPDMRQYARGRMFWMLWYGYNSSLKSDYNL